MTTTIRARFADGKIEPLEPVNLQDGDELVVTIVARRPPRTVDEVRAALRASAGAWRGLIDTDALLRDIYESRGRTGR